MSHVTLVNQIDSIAFSDSSVELFSILSAFDASDEEAAVVLVAAAQLLARQHSNETPRESDALFGLCEEFTDLVFEARKRLVVGRCRPALRLVGGTDVL